MSPEQAAAALLQVVAANREAKCRSLRGRAESEARAVLRQAYAEARSRVRAALEAMRKSARERLAIAEAQRRTRERGARQRMLKARLEQAWRLVGERLQEAWQDPAQRSLWAERYALRAVALLPAGRWEIVHPVAWTAAERERLQELLLGRGVTGLSFEADPAIDAGLRFVSGNSVLDTTTGGLLADRPGLEARLLFYAQGASP